MVGEVGEGNLLSHLYSQRWGRGTTGVSYFTSVWPALLLSDAGAVSCRCCGRPLSPLSAFGLTPSPLGADVLYGWPLCVCYYNFKIYFYIHVYFMCPGCVVENRRMDEISAVLRNWYLELKNGIAENRIINIGTGHVELCNFWSQSHLNVIIATNNSFTLHIKCMQWTAITY